MCITVGTPSSTALTVHPPLEVRTKVRHSEEKVGRVMYLVNELKFVLGRKGISGRFLLYLV
jgi:hypothetical protein